MPKKRGKSFLSFFRIAMLCLAAGKKGGEEEEFFTSEETLPDAGTVGGKCFGYIIESPKHFFVL